MMEKLRIVGQTCPSLEVASAGTFILPLMAALLAAENTAGALQKETWLKMLPGRPLTHLALPRVLGSAAVSVRLSPLKPIHRPTIALAGSAGTTGAIAGFVPVSMTSGW